MIDLLLCVEHGLKGLVNDSVEKVLAAIVVVNQELPERWHHGERIMEV